MKNMLKTLAKENEGSLPAVKTENIIFAQKTLKKFGFTIFPKELTDFWHQQNGFSAEGCHIFGIIPEPNNLMDIVNINIFYQDKLPKNNLLIAENEFDFLIYDASHQVYKIIDKQDLNVLEEYASFEQAIENIIKI